MPACVSGDMLPGDAEGAMGFARNVILFFRSLVVGYRRESECVCVCAKKKRTHNKHEHTVGFMRIANRHNEILAALPVRSATARSTLFES